jgi:hypothetical protein
MVEGILLNNGRKKLGLNNPVNFTEKLNIFYLYHNILIPGSFKN